jgi:hypothetical protein
VLAGTIETGKQFQPPYSEALKIVAEISAGLMEFCLASLTVAEATQEEVALERA